MVSICEKMSIILGKVTEKAKVVEHDTTDGDLLLTSL